MNTTQNPARRTARIVGILMLAVYAAYGAGSSIATEMAAGPGHLAAIEGSALFPAAGLAMLANSVMVIAIGVLLFPILARHDQRIALGYLATRIVEGILMAVGVISLLALTLIAGLASDGAEPTVVTALSDLAIGGNTLAYNVAMLGLGIGSLFFCFLLGRVRLVPRPVAVWGFVGYAVLAAGCVLEIAGMTGAGLVATIPGGLFELFLGVWLIVKGFDPAATASAPADSGPTEHLVSA